MSERTGLHKEVSAIFDGVPLSKDDGVRHAFDARASQRNGRVSSKPPVPSYMLTAESPHRESMQSPSKAVAAKRSWSDVAIKAMKQIPWRQILEKTKNKLFASKQGVGAARRKAMTLLVPFLLIVFVFVLIRVFKVQWPGTSKAQELDTEFSQPAGGAEGKIDWEVPAPYPAALRDPMRFGSTNTDTDGGGLIIKGIIYSEDNPSAIINSQIAHEGDEVLGATIVKINKNSVEFEMSGRRWTQKVQR